MVLEDARLGTAIGALDVPPTYRIWENDRALVVSRRDARLSRAREAAADAGSRGWPVVLRDSGGTAVPHGKGILLLSLILPQAGLCSSGLEGLYKALGGPVRSALHDLGLSTHYGDVPGSFCDGRFNLVTGGRKLAGTSQRWRGGVPPSVRPGAYVMAHMVLFVEADMTLATEAVNRYCAVAGGKGRFDPGAVTTVAEALGGARSPGRLMEEVRQGIAEAAALRAE
jgi:lipoate-protein ligase A